MYENILTLIKCIYSLVHAAHLWFKEYIKTMILKAETNKLNTDTCLLYRVENRVTVIVIRYIDGLLKIGD